MSPRASEPAPMEEFAMMDEVTKMEDTSSMEELPTVKEDSTGVETTTPEYQMKLPQLDFLRLEESRPENPRRSTEPAMPTSPSQFGKPLPLPLRARTRSPYSRTHLRSRSSASSPITPPLLRTHSSPIVDTFGHIQMPPYVRPSSPLFANTRRQSPLRRPLDGSYSPKLASHPNLDISETISEVSELDRTPRPPVTQPDPDAFPSSLLSIQHTFPRSRRRPSSPLHTLLQSPSYTTTSPGLHTSSSSPALAAKFNESYPSSLSSVPSTPTSFRSRSPSISSLETIPDSPDAEEEAQEADMVARLKAAADREDGGEGDGEREREGRRRGSLDVSRGGVRDKRKRWSVCGAERRGDLDLETIWED